MSIYLRGGGTAACRAKDRNNYARPPRSVHSAKIRRLNVPHVPHEAPQFRNRLGHPIRMQFNTPVIRDTRGHPLNQASY